MDKKHEHIIHECIGSCGAQITQKQYEEGLVTCQAKDCTHYHKPFVKKNNKTERE